jgi:uncharacterized membrane protein YjgN (DUF898 family)
MSETVPPISAPSPAAAPAPSGLPPAAPFEYHGRTRELLSICAVNLLLKVATLGVYHFWAKTRVRRYVWSRSLFAGEAFEYTGRPRELLLGYLIAMCVVLPLVVGINLLPLLAERMPVLVVLGGLAVYPVFGFLAGFGIFSARRYLLSRTRWRSIRFALTGRARDHGGWTLLYGFLAAVTGGLYLPFMRNRLTAHLVSNAWFGSERFRFDAPEDVLLHRFLRAGGLMLLILLGWGILMGAGTFLTMRYLRGADPALLAPLVLGLVWGSLLLLLPGMAACWLWYRAGELRHWVAHTYLGDARFSLELPTRRYIWLYVSNLAALLGSLGLAYPWVVVRTARTLATHLRMDGMLNLGAIEQAADQGPRTGEGLADALDLGSI